MLVDLHLRRLTAGPPADLAREPGCHRSSLPFPSLAEERGRLHVGVIDCIPGKSWYLCVPMFASR